MVKGKFKKSMKGRLKIMKKEKQRKENEEIINKKCKNDERKLKK